MTDPIAALLTVFTVLQIKHFIFDYPLQTPYQLHNKGTYCHPGGILHSGLHALGTTAAFFVVTPSLLLGAGIVIGEFLLHYHIDWGKAQVMRLTGATSGDSQFWWAIGFDQLLHHLTYVAIAGVLIVYGTL